MKRLTAIVAAFVAALVLAAGAAADTGVSLTESGSASFPNRAYLLSLPPGQVARPHQIHVRENGQSVSGATVVPASAAGPPGFGVVLVIDASRSMKGGAIRDAMAAARAFARRRLVNQQLGVAAFNQRTVVTLPLTQDPRLIDRALSSQPALGRQTHIFDAVDAALRMLATARLRPASIVVLSDGSDTGSRMTSAAVAAKARKAGVRIFSVGLHSGAFDPTALTGLARPTHGLYREATKRGDLERIFDELGARLANEYVVSYRSLAGPGAHVRVSARVDGVQGTGTAEYTTPRLRTAVAPYRTTDFWNSGAAAALVSLLVALLLVATGYFAFS